METRIIGNPSTLAIEYSVSSEKNKTPFGFCKLWINGYFLGDIGIDTYLMPISRTLKGVANLSEGDDELPRIPVSSSDFLNMIEREEIKDIFYKHSFLPMEGFDDFLKLYFKRGKNLIIYWSLHPDREDLSQYAQYPKGVRVSEISILELQKISKEFEDDLIALNT